MRPTERIKEPFPIEQIGNKNWKPIMDFGIDLVKDFNWQLGFGTLLGIVREGGIIPHDIDLDIDILIPESTEEIQERLREVERKLLEKDYIFIKEQRYNNRMMSLALFDINTKIILDYCIFYGEWGTDYLHIGTEGIVIRPQDSIETIQKDGYNIPKNYDSYLTGRYGNWRVPKNNYKNWYDKMTRSKLFIPIK